MIFRYARVVGNKSLNVHSRASLEVFPGTFIDFLIVMHYYFRQHEDEVINVTSRPPSSYGYSLKQSSFFL
jgi:hypothetical protein